MMTKEEAIKTLRELWRETNDHWYEETYSMAIEALEQMPSADVPHWIPCSERFPIIDNNNRARVLITTSWGFVKEAYYCVDHWEINDIDYILTSVIAWMPLPEPYEEGD